MGESKTNARDSWRTAIRESLDERGGCREETARRRDRAEPTSVLPLTPGKYKTVGTGSQTR